MKLVKFCPPHSANSAKLGEMRITKKKPQNKHKTLKHASCRSYALIYNF